MGDYQFHLLELNKFIFPTKNFRRTEVRIELPKEIVFIRELQQENNTLINETQNLKAKKIENDIFSVSDTGILGKRNSEFSQQESNLRPSDY